MNNAEKLIQEVVEILRSSKSFAAEQMPDLAKQTLEWLGISSGIWACSSLFLVIICFLVMIIAIRTMPGRTYEQDGNMILIFTALLLIAIFSVIAITQSLQYIKIKATPKVALMDYFINKTRSCNK